MTRANASLTIAVAAVSDSLAILMCTRDEKPPTHKGRKRTGASRSQESASLAPGKSACLVFLWQSVAPRHLLLREPNIPWEDWERESLTKALQFRDERPSPQRYSPYVLRGSHFLHFQNQLRSCLCGMGDQESPLIFQ